MFEEFKNALSLYKFYKGTITWLIESFDENMDIRLVVQKQSSGMNVVYDDDITRIISSHRLPLLKLNKIMLDERLTKEKKCIEFLNLKYLDKDTFENIIDFFEQNCNDNLFLYQFFSEKKNVFLHTTTSKNNF